MYFLSGWKKPFTNEIASWLSAQRNIGLTLNQPTPNKLHQKVSQLKSYMSQGRVSKHRAVPEVGRKELSTAGEYLQGERLGPGSRN